MAVDMFIKIDDIKGEAIDKASPSHQDEIQVLSWQWGMTQQGSFAQGPGGGTGRTDVEDLSFTHYIDLASPNLHKFCCMGKHLKKAVLTLRKAGGKKPVEYLKITLSDVAISGVKTGSSTDSDRVTETVSLNFSKFQVDYTSQTPTGDADKTVTAIWDVAGNVEG